MCSSDLAFEADVPIRMSSWTAIEVGWTSQTNKLYQVQWTALPNTNEWFNLGDPIRGNGNTNALLDSTRFDPKKFYRVITVE